MGFEQIDLQAQAVDLVRRSFRLYVHMLADEKKRREQGRVWRALAGQRRALVQRRGGYIRHWPTFEDVATLSGLAVLDRAAIEADLERLKGPQRTAQAGDPGPRRKQRSKLNVEAALAELEAWQNRE